MNSLIMTSASALVRYFFMSSQVNYSCYFEVMIQVGRDSNRSGSLEAGHIFLMSIPKSGELDLCGESLSFYSSDFLIERYISLISISCLVYLR